MLSRFTVSGFKSLDNVTVNLPRLTVLFGPNAVGKSNLLDAVQALSRIATSRTLSDALTEPIRGYPIEAFAFPPGGLPALLSQQQTRFSLAAILDITGKCFEYKITIEIELRSGSLSVRDEYLASFGTRGGLKGSPSIERIEGNLSIRRKSKPGNPRKEPVGQNYAILSDRRLAGSEYRAIERCREELSSWRTYYLDPRVAMRTAKPPSDARDIGVLGEDIAPFLYRLNADAPRNFAAVTRTLRTLIPSVEDLTVDLDKRRGTLDIQIRQDGTDFSSRIISEGTLRVLALCAIAANPWGGSLLAFEEPENGVHPRRLDLIARLLVSLATSPAPGQSPPQVIVTTHSPIFCDSILDEKQSKPDSIALLNVRHGQSGTEVHPFPLSGPLFRKSEVTKALTSSSEDGVFSSLMMRGLLDE